MPPLHCCSVGHESVALLLHFCGAWDFPEHFCYNPYITMKIRLHLVYADGDAAATLLQSRRWSYALNTLLYPFYIKSEVQLIYVQLNVNDRHTQVAMLQLAIMNHRLIMLAIMNSRQDRGWGPKGSGSVHGYPQTHSYNFGTMTN